MHAQVRGKQSLQLDHRYMPFVANRDGINKLVCLRSVFALESANCQGRKNSVIDSPTDLHHGRGATRVFLSKMQQGTLACISCPTHTWPLLPLHLAGVQSLAHLLLNTY